MAWGTLPPSDIIIAHPIGVCQGGGEIFFSWFVLGVLVWWGEKKISVVGPPNFDSLFESEVEVLL